MPNLSIPLTPVWQWMGFIMALDKHELLDSAGGGNLISTEIPICSGQFEVFHIERWTDTAIFGNAFSLLKRNKLEASHLDFARPVSAHSHLWLDLCI